MEVLMITLKNVSKYYYNKGIIASGFTKINLTLHMGEFVAITGESGSGKSTLLNVISGLDTYEEGEMYINGKETSHYTEADFEAYRKKYISNIFQDFNLVNSYTVYENIILPLQAMNIPRREIKRRTNEMMERMGIAELRDMYPAQISGGQKQRTAIARALVGNPKLILADEPTGSLDVRTGDEIMQIFKEINEQGKTIIIVTHDEKIAKQTKRGIRLENSMIAYDERIDKLEDR